ncbi:hypothetical protein FD755_011638 [Muntiacus reevesi]|uniref:Protein-cysteine N-palmitoyltransferase HHAT n=1 Tax=Muntiacus reevesi TaxID=9886 RepID=A0A5N3XX45_MUNRE|nr:hypothetical protein FD755_011638 [Muntiacus reevesi]
MLGGIGGRRRRGRQRMRWLDGITDSMDMGVHESTLARGFHLPLPGSWEDRDPTDFEWSFWMEWGKERLVWLFLGHMSVSQVANLLSRKHKPWVLAAYGMWACRCALGARGTAVVLVHTAIAFCVAQFRSQALSWLCSLSLLSTLRLQDVEEVKRGWYQTENEYYLLQFTLTVRCLYCTSFSLELCWQPPPAERPFYSLPWMLAYVFYYPVFHNGPVLSFPEFIAQMRQQEQSPPKTSLSILVLGLGRLLFYWWLAELMVHLMYMHAIYSSASLLRAVSSWTLDSLLTEPPGKPTCVYIHSHTGVCCIPALSRVHWHHFLDSTYSSIPSSGRSRGEGIGYPLQYSWASCWWLSCLPQLCTFTCSVSRLTFAGLFGRLSETVHHQVRGHLGFLRCYHLRVL